MAVVFPIEDDKNNLLAYIEKFHLNRDDTDDRVTTLRASDKFFQSEDVRNVECACDSVLVNLRKLKTFFITGGPLVAQEMHNNFEAGDAETFSSVSIADVFSRKSPLDVFSQHKEAMEILKAEFLNSRDTMRQVNAKNAFIWTTNVSKLQRWFHSGSHRSALLAKHKMWETAAEKSPVERSRIVDKISQEKDDSATGGHSVGQAASEHLSDTFLLSLKADQLPSEIVKNSYAKFVQACTSSIGWLTNVLDILNGVDDVPRPGKFIIQEGQSPERDASHEGQPADSNPQIPTHRARTVTVRCFEIHDAYQIYTLLFEQAAYFFQPTCTQYDARVQRRLLQPSYFYSMRELIDELINEINRLKEVARQKPFALSTNPNLIPYNLYAQSSEAPCTTPEGRVHIFFRPPLSYFCFLCASLQLYLSICLSEDDLTSLLYFRHLYRNFLAEARDVAHGVGRLPMPHRTAAPRPPHPFGDLPDGALCAPAPPRRQGVDNINNNNNKEEEEEDNNDEGETAAAKQQQQQLLSLSSAPEWVPSAEERGQLDVAFEAYWSVRQKVGSLRRALEKDIRSKNATHRTRVLSSCVQDEKGPAFLEAEQRLNAQRSTGDQQDTSFWASAMNSLRMVSRILTCRAEIDFDLYDQFVGNVDSEGIPMTTTSPYHEEKTEVLNRVNQLWDVIDLQGAQLEKRYLNLFFRGNKSRWTKRFKELAKKAETMSVVFET